MDFPFIYYYTFTQFLQEKDDADFTDAGHFTSSINENPKHYDEIVYMSLQINKVLDYNYFCYLFKDIDARFLLLSFFTIFEKMSKVGTGELAEQAMKAFASYAADLG